MASPDLNIVKENIESMIQQGAPEADIDAYIASEGVTIDQLQGAPEGGAPYDPAKSLKNAPESAYEFGKAMVYPFMHPAQTLQNLIDLPSGAIREGARAVLPEQTFSDYDEYLFGPKPIAERSSQTAQAVGGFYKDRYGSWDQFKRTLESDPIGVAGDAATVLTGGEMAANRIPGAIGKATAKTLGTAANVVNPLTPVTVAGRVGNTTLKNTLGMTTGTSAETIGEAYKAGRAGGEQGAAFRRNMRGQEDQGAVLEQAQDALGNMADARRAQYQQDMAAIGADKTPINFDPVVHAFNKAYDSAFQGGHQKASNEVITKLNQMGKVLEEWQNDPSMHTAIGMDALKQRIDAMMPGALEPGNAGRVVTEVRNAVKDAIVQQAPTYAKAMESYEKAIRTETELKKSLSLGKGNSEDTALRKLQSVTRNNANTNYGSRVKNAKTLEDAGAKTLMPSLAGQALNTWLPRGLRGPMASAAITGLGSYFSPFAIPALLAGSPRLVGEAAHLAGRAGKAASRLPRPTRKGLLGARALGSAGLLGSQSQ